MLDLATLQLDNAAIQTLLMESHAMISTTAHKLIFANLESAMEQTL